MSDVPTRAGRREWVGLAVLALPTLLVSFDLFVLLLALPQLTADLHATSTAQLWIMDSYGFLAGGFLITMGSLGDRIGHRRLLMFGAAAFGAASLMAAFSTTPEMLIAARVLLGVAGATLAPSTLALIGTMFRDPAERGVAIGVWAGCFTVGAILGPIVGGVMLEHFWWGSVFLLGVPPMVLLLLLAPIVLREVRSAGAGRVDVTSAALSLAAILSTIWGIKELARGQVGLSVAAVLVGIGLGVIFVRRQRRLAHPMLDVGLFAHRDFTASLVGLLFYSVLTGAALLFVTQFFQSVAGLTPLQAGLAMIPGLAAGTVSVTVSPILGRRWRPAYLMAAGMLVVAAGLVILTQADARSGPLVVIIGFAVWCLGGGPLLALGMNLVVSSVPPEKMGAASAIPQVSNELGAALGIATVGTLGTLVYRLQFEGHRPAGLPADVDVAARESVAGAEAAAGGLTGPVAGELISAARAAFTDGLHTVAAVGAVLIACCAVYVLRRLRHLPPTGRAADDVAEPTGPTESPVPVHHEAA